MTKAPRITVELDGHSRHASTNCLFCTLCSLIAWASLGKVTTTPDELRTRGNIETPGNIFVGKAIWDGFAPDFAKAGLTFQTMNTRSAIGDKFPIFRPISELWNALADTEQAALAIGSYGAVNKLAPRLSGDPRFMDAHVLCFWGIDATSVTAIDSLADGRRKGIASGPQKWPRTLVRAFLAAFSRVGAGKPLVGDGYGVFGLVHRSVPVAVTPADPPTPDHSEADYEALDALYQDAEQQVLDLRDALVAVRALFGTDAAAIEAIIDSVIPPVPAAVAQAGATGGPAGKVEDTSA